MSEPNWSLFETRLRTYVRRRVEVQWVDDVVGDILLRLVRHRDSLDAAANPLAFVLRVATNAITDHYRRRSVEKPVLTDLEADPAGAPAEERAAGELARCVQPFIQALPEKYREALLLTEIDGLTRAEAARRAGISESGMKSRVQRGRARLKQALLRCCSVELDRRGGVAGFAQRAAGCGRDC